MKDLESPVLDVAPARLSRRALLQWSPLLWLGCIGMARAQVLSDAVQKATSVDGVISAIGAKPELSSHLSLDVPDVMLPGKVRVRFSSEIAGTAWLVLLRGRKGVPPLPISGQPLEPVLLAANPFSAGARAKSVLNVEIATTQYLTLLALARGRWYYVEREVKMARSR